MWHAAPSVLYPTNSISTTHDAYPAVLFPTAHDVTPNQTVHSSARIVSMDISPSLRAARVYKDVWIHSAIIANLHRFVSPVMWGTF